MLAYDHLSVIFNLRQFQVDRQQVKAHLVENVFTCSESNKFYEKKTNVKLQVLN